MLKLEPVQEIEAGSLLTRSKLPGVDFVINPFVGCQFGCSYCYATFMCRMVKRSRLDWGRFLYVKQYSEDKLLKQLTRLPSSKTILLSSVTDPYTFAENKLGRTRTILEIIKKSGFAGSVSILTKSPSVIRDINIIKAIPGAEVGLTIPVLGDPTMRGIEHNAPSGEARFAALERLQADLKTFAFFAPLMPHHTNNLDLIESTILRLSKFKLEYMFVELLDPKPYVWQRMLKEQEIDITIEQAKEKIIDLREIVNQLLQQHTGNFNVPRIMV